MKLLLDENVEPAWARLLQQQFKVHTFSSAGSEHLLGVDDEDLFAELAARDYDALVTNDVRQLERDHERRALHESGLSWVGIQSDPKARGRKDALLRLSTLIAGLAVLDEIWRPDPWAYLLQRVTATEQARVQTLEIWRAAWGPRPGEDRI